MATDEAVVGLRERVRHSRMPASAPPGQPETVAWTLLHRAVPFDPAVQAAIAAQWGLPVPPLHGRGPRATAAAHTPATTHRTRAGLHRLAALARSCPPPQALIQAVELAVDRPDLTEPNLRGALAQAGLSEGAAGSALLSALAALWPTASTRQVLEPAGWRLPGLQHLAAAVRQVGAVRHPCPPATETRWLQQHTQVVWTAGHLIAASDHRSAIASAIRRQLAAVGQLDAPGLLLGAARAHPAARTLTSTGLAAWATAQHDLTWQQDQLQLHTDSARWLHHADPPVLALFLHQPQATRPELLRALTDSGLTPPGASQWVVHCPWLRPTSRRGNYRPASPAHP